MDNPSLMHGEGAEAACPTASPVRNNGKPDCLETGNHTPFLIAGMRPPRVRKRIDRVKVGLRKRERGRVVNHKTVAVPLEQGPAFERVLARANEPECLVEFVAVFPHVLERGDLNGFAVPGRLLPYDHGAWNAGQIIPLFQPSGYFHDLLLAHAVHKDIGFGVEEDRPSHLVVPPIVVGKPAKAGLYASEHNWNRSERFTHAVGVDYRGSVRTETRFASRGIGIPGAGLFVGCIVGHH
ncbi:MAG: hypothetical protein A4E57_02300 [Syntrophorhabdaceae bacterium PtaU1.Bin034]|nr:MAG: hypothetical protein A4E57_02300 [Syntrophorhabdaceae bacterium PtaU1.Bin034]